MNELSSNGFTRGAIALWTSGLDYTHIYPALPYKEAFGRVRKLLDSPDAGCHHPRSRRPALQ